MNDDDNKKKPDLTEQVEDSRISFKELASKNAKPSKLDRITTIVLLLICVALAVYFIAGSVQGREHAVVEENETASVINVQTAVAEKGRFERYTRLNGEIKSYNTDVGIMPDTSGKVVSVLVRSGSEIKKGDVIAYIDASRPGQTFNESPVTSTVDGVVTSVPVSVGETVSVSTPIATVAGERTLYIEAELPERYIGTMKEGMDADFSSVAYPGKTFTGVVSFIAPSIDEATRTARIEIQITDDSEGLLSGMYVTLNLITEAYDDVIMVPLDAVSSYNGEEIVYVAENDTARMRSVTAGRENGDMVIILSGLEEGDEIITAGSVNDGSSINVIG